MIRDDSAAVAVVAVVDLIFKVLAKFLIKIELNGLPVLS